ncbi:MAG: IS3 family transposase [Candidatus Handelsmanbacteria bacterium]|nr:IS3 family transposase [Candidatus Handelsmanbacteria bacterium]
MCRLLGVSPSRSYAWCRRQPSARARADQGLRQRIKAIHAWTDGPYGVPRILEELRGEETRIGVKRVARLMRQERLQGVSRRPGTKTTRRAVDAAPTTDLVERDFTATAPNQLWVADPNNQLAFGTRCQQAGIRPSRSTVGDCFDNALCESFFATLECELIDRRAFHTQTQARQQLFRYSDGYYNPIGVILLLNLSPINYKKR